MKTFSSKVVSTDPDGADQWAESISDPTTRQAQVTSVLQAWMATDVASATAAVQKSSLPADVKNQLLQSRQ
ncbi:MAG: hypothetical protein WDO13_05020 [Verrucomicrobiota bacterium]